MNKFIFFLALILGIPSISLGQKLLYSIDDKSSSIAEFQKLNNIGNVNIIYGNDIYPDKFDEVNLTTLERAIINSFPSASATGYGVLDWEGKAYHALLYKNSNSADFNKSIKEFTKALKLAKSLRPNVKWGFFNLPFRRLLFKTDKLWNQQNKSIASLLKETDVFYPVFYSRTINEKIDTNYLNLLGQLSTEYGKPMVAFIWHRVEGSTNRYSKVNKKIFINNSKILMNNKNISKVVWWSKDTYFYKNKNKTFTSEARSLNDFKLKYDDLIKSYTKSMLQ